MSDDAVTAFRVAEALRADGPWEVYAERSRRFEVHLDGRRVEMIRGPITIEGYGIRLLRRRNGSLGAGYQSSTDLTPDGIGTVVADAEATARHSEFPAKTVELPTGRASAPPPEIVDPALWSDPRRAIDDYVAEMFRRFDGRPGIAPSFGSVRATLIETTIANSAGLRVAYPQTCVDFEVAVKAFGGPEGAPPGEYWVNAALRRLDAGSLGDEVDHWCRYAQDVRRAGAPPTGDIPVVLPSSVLAGILPPVLGYRFTGAARLRKLAPSVGERVAAESVTIRDSGLVPWAPASAPYDGEGSPHASHPLIASGKVAGLLYDVRHAGAFDEVSTGSATRSYGPGGFADWQRYLHDPHVGSSTLSIDPGPGGSDTELVEAADDGIWVQQLGWAIPDEISGAFGGEIRIGYRIRHGKLAEPVRGGTVGGVVMAPVGSPSLLANVAAVGSRAELSEGVYTPALLVRPLVVAGAGAAPGA